MLRSKVDKEFLAAAHGFYNSQPLVDAAPEKDMPSHGAVIANGGMVSAHNRSARKQHLLVGGGARVKPGDHKRPRGDVAYVLPDADVVSAPPPSPPEWRETLRSEHAHDAAMHNTRVVDMAASRTSLRKRRVDEVVSNPQVASLIEALALADGVLLDRERHLQSRDSLVGPPAVNNPGLTELDAPRRHDPVATSAPPAPSGQHRQTGVAVAVTLAVSAALLYLLYTSQ